MDRLTPELARILEKRIRRVIEKARYHPASVSDMDEAAREVVRPYLPLNQRVSKKS